MRKLRLTFLGALLTIGSVASAATIAIPDTVVSGTQHVFTGPSIVLTVDLLPTDTLSLVAYGEVFLQTGNKYGINPAGVVTTAGTRPVGTAMLYNSFDYGALLLGNDSLGFFQLFSANAANGLGSPAPPHSLSLSNTQLSSIGFTSTLQAGTQLQLRVWDSNTSDNGGLYHVSGQFNANEVPEPSTIALIGAGLGVLALLRRLA